MTLEEARMLKVGDALLLRGGEIVAVVEVSDIADEYPIRTVPVSPLTMEYVSWPYPEYVVKKIGNNVKVGFIDSQSNVVMRNPSEDDEVDTFFVVFKGVN